MDSLPGSANTMIPPSDRAAPGADASISDRSSSADHVDLAVSPRPQSAAEPVRGNLPLRQNGNLDGENDLCKSSSEAAATAEALVKETCELLTRFTLMDTKARLLSERLELLRIELPVVMETTHTVQLESVLHALLESVRNVADHCTPYETVVAYFLLDSERTNMNMHLQSLTLAGGSGEAGNALHDLMTEVTECDVKDVNKDSSIFREALLAIRKDGEAAEKILERDEEALHEHVEEVQRTDDLMESRAGLMRRKKLGMLAHQLEGELKDSDDAHLQSMRRHTQRNEAPGVRFIRREGNFFLNGTFPRSSSNRSVLSAASSNDSSEPDASSQAEAETEHSQMVPPALDIRRPNIYRIISLLAQVVKEANGFLDLQTSLRLPFLQEDEMDGSQKVRLGSKICFVEIQSDGTKMLSFRPFSQANRSGSGPVLYDSLSARSRAEIRRELALWSKLDNRNVLHIYGAVFSLNSMAIYMEPSDLTLFDFLYKEGRQPVGKELETMMRGLVRGLSYLHQNNIVHRQLSPHNILLSYDRGLRLAGFGFGWVEASIRESVQVQYAYMAPELLRTGVSSTRRLSFSSDVYAAGMLLYEMSHHKRPFAGATYNEVVSIVGDQFIQPSIEHDVIVALGSWFPTVLAKCWDKDATHRPSARSLFNTVRNNTRLSARTSGRVMQSMLNFLPRRNAASPQPALEVLNKKNAKSEEIQKALTQLLDLALQQVRTGKEAVSSEKKSTGTATLPPSPARRFLSITRRKKTNAPVVPPASKEVSLDWFGMGDDEDENVGDEDDFSGRSMSESASGGGNGEWFFSRLWDLDGAKSIVDQLANHGEDPLIVDLCLRLLRIIGRSQFEPYFSDRQQALVVEYKAVELISDVMNHHLDAVKILEDGAGALKSLSSAGDDVLLNDMRRARMVESDAVSLVLRAMEAHPDSLMLQAHGIGLIRNVSFSEEAINMPIMEEAVPLIVHACQTHSSRMLTRKVVAALSNLSFAPSNQERMLDEPFAIRVLVSAVQTSGGDPRLLATAFLAFWNLLYRDPVLAIKLERMGIQEFIRAALRRYPEDSNLVGNSLSLVDGMAWAPEVRQLLVDDGMITAVEDAMRLQPGVQEVWEAGISALKSLSWSSTETLQDMATIEYIFVKVTSIYLLNLDILRNALLLLQNMTCIEENLVVLANNGAAEWVLRAMGAHPKDGIIAEAGSGALCNLATPDANKEVIFKSGVLSVLQRTLRIHTENETVSRNAACAIVRLARSPSVYEAMDRDALAGPLKGVSHRYPELTSFPDLQDLDELFPVDSALLDRCSICLEELYIDQTAMPYTCEHSFHLRCVGKWATLNKTCPLCRAPMNEGFEIPDDISEVDPHYEEDEALLAPFLEEAQRGRRSGRRSSSSANGSRQGSRQGSRPRLVLRTRNSSRAQAMSDPGEDSPTIRRGNAESADDDDDDDDDDDVGATTDTNTEADENEANEEQEHQEVHASGTIINGDNEQSDHISNFTNRNENLSDHAVEQTGNETGDQVLDTRNVSFSTRRNSTAHTSREVNNASGFEQSEITEALSLGEISENQGPQRRSSQMSRSSRRSRSSLASRRSQTTRRSQVSVHSQSARRSQASVRSQTSRRSQHLLGGRHGQEDEHSSAANSEDDDSASASPSILAGASLRAMDGDTVVQDDDDDEVIVERLLTERLMNEWNE